MKCMLFKVLHYIFCDDMHAVDVRQEQRLLPYIRQLLESAFDSELSERVSLYWNKGDPLVSIHSLANRDIDFFVSKEFFSDGERFQRRSRTILHSKQPLRNDRVSDVFGDARDLQLTYIGTPGVELSRDNDFAVVSRWSDTQNKIYKKKLLRKMAEELAMDESRWQRLRNADLSSVRVLALMAANDEALSAEDIAEILQEGVYDCVCYFQEVDALDVVGISLEKLERAGYVRHSNRTDEFHVRQRFRKPAPCMRYDNPDQLKLFS